MAVRAKNNIIIFMREGLTGNMNRSKRAENREHPPTSEIVGLRPLKARLSLEGARLGVGALLGALVPVGNCLVLLVA